MSADEAQQLDLDEPAHSLAKRRRGMFYLGLASAAVGFCMMLQLSLNDNFLVEQMGIDGFHKGVLEAFRESCGILAFLLLALLTGLAEPLIGAVMLVLLGVGLGCYSGVESYAGLVGLSLLWSQGLHVWMPLPNSMVLAMAEPGQTGRRLGQMSAAGAVGSAAGLLVALGLTALHVAIRPLYILAGAAAVLGAIACLGIPRDIKTPGQRLVIRRKYGLYYLLNFLEGWRKQIFFAFAGFLLVNEYKMPLWEMLLLWTGGQAVSYVVAPRVGRLIDRVGEQRVLIFYYTCLTLLFCGYAMVPNRAVLCGLFIADNVLSTLTMGLTTYVRRIAPPSEHTATLSMGVATNHVAAVAMPLAGGFLWKFLGYQWVFFAGAAAAAVSVLVVRVMLRPSPANKASS